MICFMAFLSLVAASLGRQRPGQRIFGVRREDWLHL